MIYWHLGRNESGEKARRVTSIVVSESVFFSSILGTGQVPHSFSVWKRKRNGSVLFMIVSWEIFKRTISAIAYNIANEFKSIVRIRESVGIQIRRWILNLNNSRGSCRRMNPNEYKFHSIGSFQSCRYLKKYWVIPPNYLCNLFQRLREDVHSINLENLFLNILT